MLDVVVPRLADDRADGRLRVSQRPHADVVGGLHAAAPGHSERADLGVGQVQLADEPKVLAVLLIGQRVAAFDKVHAHFVEPLGDVPLVLDAMEGTVALTVASDELMLPELAVPPLVGADPPAISGLLSAYLTSPESTAILTGTVDPGGLLITYTP